MKRGPVVSNASPLIGLERIGQLSLLPQIFSSVVIPTAVADEVFATARVPDWIEVNALQQVISVRFCNMHSVEVKAKQSVLQLRLVRGF